MAFFFGSGPAGLLWVLLAFLSLLLHWLLIAVSGRNILTLQARGGGLALLAELLLTHRDILNIVLLCTLTQPLGDALGGVCLLAVLPHLLLTFFPNLLSDAVVLIHIIAVSLKRLHTLHLLVYDLRNSARRTSKLLLNTFLLLPPIPTQDEVEKRVRS